MAKTPKISKDAKQQAEDLVSVMKTDFGRRFVWAQLGLCGIYHECFSPEQEGARRVGLDLIKNLMLFCPSLYLMMQGEAMDEQTKKRVEKELQELTKGEADGLESEEG